MTQPRSHCVSQAVLYATGLHEEDMDKPHAGFGAFLAFRNSWNSVPAAIALTAALYRMRIIPGFSNPVRVIFQAIFRQNIVEDTRATVGVHFRTAVRRRRDETHLVDRLFSYPMGDVIGWLARSLAAMHHGNFNAYVSYSSAILVLILFLYRLT